MTDWCLASSGRERGDCVKEIGAISNGAQANIIDAGIEVYLLEEVNFQAAGRGEWEGEDVVDERADEDEE